ncbi:MAG: TerB family tellurite resistance protein [Sedimentisphaeraceae bacterium JB056]
MALLGKLIGGFVGFQFAGPIGAILGAVLGHNVFDKEHKSVVGSSIPTPNQHKQLIYFTAVFSCMAKMAKADGVVDKREIEAIENFMVQNLRLDQRTRQFAISIFDKAKDDDVDVSRYLDQLAKCVNYDHELCLSFVYILHKIAMADGRLHPAEAVILRKAEGVFRLRPGTVDALIGEGVDDLKKCYELLECSPEMTDAQIKTAYRKKCKENHPDHLASKGLPEEFIKLANEKMAKINEAYDKIVKNRKS